MPKKPPNRLANKQTDPVEVMIFCKAHNFYKFEKI